MTGACTISVDLQNLKVPAENECTLLSVEWDIAIVIDLSSGRAAFSGKSHDLLRRYWTAA